MAANNPNHPKLSYLAGMADGVIITNIVKRENCDEYYVTFKPPDQRKCPHCGANNCVIKDANRNQAIRNIIPPSIIPLPHP